jgi:radical SAM superfamily enzyme YgiQ (UPF0313 family)
MKYGKKPRGHRPKVLLVQLPVPPPAALAATGNSALAAGCLAAAMRAHGVADRFSVEVDRPSDTDRLGDAALADRIGQARPMVVGLSLYVWNLERSLHLARQIRRRSPETLIVVGGPEVEPDNRFLLGQEGIDVAVRGEAEEVFPEILNRLSQGEEIEGTPGTSVRAANGLGAFTISSLSAFPLARYPSPYLAGILPVEAERSVYVETARGCSSRCEFCYYSRGDVGVRRLDVKAVSRLCGQLKDAGARGLIVLDPSFNQRPDFRPILDALASVNSDKRLSFFAEIKAEGLEETDWDLLGKAGFTDVEIGLQSVRSDTLRRIRRGGDAEQVARVGMELKKRGIEPRIDLILGLPGDTAQDVLRGVEFLEGKGLADQVQILPLSVLPGTALRQKAGEYGIVFDEAPPYRIIRTAEMSEEEIMETMRKAEDILDRPLDEYPRPHLVSVNQAGTPPDALLVNLDGDESVAIKSALRPGASHVALWMDGTDLFGQRDLIRRAIEARLSVDPHSTLDVVLVAREAFPLDLVDFVKDVLEKGPPTYGTRQLAWRPGNSSRRVCAVLPADAPFDPDHVEHLMAEIPVFRDMTAIEAMERAGDLGETLPGARILGSDMLAGSTLLTELSHRTDPESVVFESRRLETWWTNDILGYRDAPAMPASPR